MVALIFIAFGASAKQGVFLPDPSSAERAENYAAAEVERQARIQVLKSIDAEMQARAADRAAAAVATPLDVAAAAAPRGSMQYGGLQGDYIGGVYGTIASIATLLIIAGTFLWTRKNDAKAKIYQVFTEMLRTHEEAVSSMRVGDARGREAFAAILSEFSFIYKATCAHAPNWSLEQRMDIAFTFTYYGPQLSTLRTLEAYELASLQLVGDAIAAKQRQDAKANNERLRQRFFKGHQNRLSHYFRNLFGAYRLIDEAAELSEKEKKYLGKILRAKLSNYEQALLLLNAKSHLGREWRTLGMLARYQPIKNVPQHFFSFDEKNFRLKEQFPEIDFEGERKS